MNTTLPSKTRIYSLFAAIIGLAFAFTATTAKAQITVGTVNNYSTKATFEAASVNPNGCSKMVVVITGEHHFAGDTSGNINSLTFAGNALTKAVDRAPVSGNIIAHDIWYLDNPGAVAGSFVMTQGGNGVNYVFTVIRLTGTALGDGASAVSASNSKSVSLTTTAADAIVVASHGLGGDGNTGATSAVNATSPAVEIAAISHANNYVGQCVSTTNPVATPGVATYAFTGGSTTGVVTIAAEFYRAEAVAPTIATYNPADDATGVATNASLVATFSETIQKGTGNILVKNLTDATTTTIAVTDAQITVSGTTMTINPSLDLVGGKSYAVQIAAGAIKDFAGNNFAGIADDTTWNFDTAADTIPPTIVTRSPADGANAVAVGSNLVATFNETIVLGTGDIRVKNLTDSTTTTITLPNAQVTVSGAVLTINPSSDLLVSKNYAIQIDATVIDDTAGNSFAGILNDTAWNFNTDNVAPVIATLSPADNAFAVAVSSNLVATYNENIAKGSGDITIKNLTDAIDTVIPVGDAQITVSGAVMTINPTADLLANKNYAIRIAGGAIKDLANNNSAAVSNDTTWNFNTDSTLPTISGVNFVDNKGGGPVLPNSVVTYTVTFSEDMNSASVTAADFVNAGTATVTIGTVTEPSAGVFSVPVTPTSTGTLQLQIPSGAILNDVAGNALNTASAITDDTTLSVGPVTYWDTDGATAGAGGSGSPSGAWATAGTTWTTDATGSTATSAYTTLATGGLHFSAGTDAIASYAITLTDTQNAKLLTFEEGTPTFTGGTISLGAAGGLTVNAGAGDPVISSGLTIAGQQTFNVGTGRILTLDTGSFTRGTRATLNVPGAGTVTSTQTGLAVGDLANGIVGPWASIGNGATTRYATIDGSNNLVLLTGTAAALSTDVTDVTGTFNYDLAAAGTLGASASVNTLRYTGAAGTLTSSTLFTTKGIMNVSGNSLALAGAWTSGGSGTEMVLHTANGNMNMTGAAGLLTGTLTKTGSGTFTMGNGAAHSIGAMTVNEGVLVTGHLNGDGLGTAAVTINSGGTLRWGSSSRHGNGAVFTINAGGTLDVADKDDLIGAVNGAGSITGTTGRLQLQAGTSNFSGIISGSGMRFLLNNDGAATVTLSGANVYGGSTTIELGTLILNNEFALGGNNPGVNGTSGIDLSAGAILRSNFLGGNTEVYAPITLSGTGDANIQIGAGTSTAPATQVVFNLNGAITGPATARVVFSTSGSSLNNSDSIVVLGAASSYLGETLISAGNTANRINVKAGVANALPATTVLTLDGINGTGSGRLVQYDLNGNNQTLAGLTNNTTRTLRNQWINNTGSAATLTINNTSDYSFGGTFGSQSARITGAIALTKTGAGKQTLSGPNNYTGVTTISAGTLALASTGTINSTSGVTIGTASTAATTEFNYSSVTALSQPVAFASLSTGGTLSGTGTITQAVTIPTGNTLSPGNSIGSLGFGGTLTLSTGSTASFEVDADTIANRDQVTGISALTYGGKLKITATGTLSAGDSWDLFDFTSQTGTFDNTASFGTDGSSDADLPDLGSGLTWQFDYATGILSVAGGSNYASWANDPAKGNIPGEPASGDFDNDGITNIVEYALGKNPRLSTQPAGVLSGNTITYTKGADAIANDDVSWIIETSETLLPGSWSDAVIQSNTNNDPDISYLFTPSTPVKKFARLKVIQLP